MEWKYLFSTLMAAVSVAGMLAERGTTGEAALPMPTAEQLAWSKLEVGAIVCFNLITYTGGNGEQHRRLHSDEGDQMPPLSNKLWEDSQISHLPSPELFNPTKLNISQWSEAVQAFDAKYAVLVAKHNTGFTLWPSQVKFPAFDFVYNYTISASPSPSKDIVKDFVGLMKASGILPAIYMSLATNEFLNVRANHVQGGALMPGQANVTQEQYDEISLALLSELWTEYGPLAGDISGKTSYEKASCDWCAGKSSSCYGYAVSISQVLPLEEVWFDGGFSPDIKQRLAKQLAEQQPHATAFNGFGISPNAIRWIGTETGHAPADTWSTTNGGESGGGDPNGTSWYPPECDTTLQNYDRWFYNKKAGMRSLSQLIQVYHDTVGHNCNLLLDVSPTTDGDIDPQHMAQLKAFGNFIRQCYTKGTPVNSTSGKGNVIELTFASPATFDRLVIMEDQTKGQCIRGYNTSILADGHPDNLPATLGHSIGNKRIDLLPSPAENIKSVRLQITNTAPGCTPAVSMFAAFDCRRLTEEVVQLDQSNS